MAPAQRAFQATRYFQEWAGAAREPRGLHVRGAGAVASAPDQPRGRLHG
jgi:hypothetical protein